MKRTGPGSESGAIATSRRQSDAESPNATAGAAPTTGDRCRETRLLEFHHLDAYANGGEPTEENLTLRCRAHEGR
jgi:hypothetical protein